MERKDETPKEWRPDVTQRFLATSRELVETYKDVKGFLRVLKWLASGIVALGSLVGAVYMIMSKL
jgi:hypothetical protein